MCELVIGRVCVRAQWYLLVQSAESDVAKESQRLLTIALILGFSMFSFLGALTLDSGMGTYYRVYMQDERN
jgi:hypothetical protein